jgi:hypothetical protein
MSTYTLVGKLASAGTLSLQIYEKYEETLDSINQEKPDACKIFVTQLVG